MQVKRTNSSETDIKLTIVASDKELSAIKQQVLSRLRSKVKIAGFRSGKAPLELVEKHLDSSTVQSEFIDESINQLYVQAIGSEKLRPISNPQVNIIKFVPFTTLDFEANISVIGEIELPDYKKIKKKLESTKISADEVKEVLSSLAERSASKEDVKTAAKLGDEVTINFSGKDSKEKPVSGTDGKEYPLVLGSNSFIPGFEDGLVGLKAGDKKDLPLTFPKDYHAKEMAGKKVTFSTEVLKVQKLTTPKIDDEFAKTLGPFKNLDELKTDIKKQLQVERDKDSRKRYENELIEQLASKTKVALPKAIVDDQMNWIESQEKQNLAYQGQTWEEHLKAEKVTAEEHLEQKRPEAEKGVKASLMLSRIAEIEGLEVTPEELEMHMSLLRGQYSDKAMQAELDNPENQREISGRLLTNKTISFLVDLASK